MLGASGFWTVSGCWSIGTVVSVAAIAGGTYATPSPQMHAATDTNRAAKRAVLLRMREAVLIEGSLRSKRSARTSAHAGMRRSSDLLAHRLQDDHGTVVDRGRIAAAGGDAVEGGRAGLALGAVLGGIGALVEAGIGVRIGP